MRKALASSTSQLTLALFDSTAPSCGLTLDAASTPSTNGARHRAPSAAEGDAGHAEPGAAATAAAQPERAPARNYRLTGERALAQGWKARAADNLAAIRLMRTIEAEGRPATAGEQARLALFTGFGASDLANACFRRAGEAFRPGWEQIGNELERLASPQELAGLMRATQYAHYTPEFLARAIWRALGRMGFAGGAVLEPGCGTGLFLATLPGALAPRTAFTGIESCPVTARIAKLLYPEAWIRAEDFTKARLAERYDLVVGNPPFSDRSVRADAGSAEPGGAGRLGLSLHDYFIARSVERLRPGGLAAFVTSRFTLDKRDATAREHIASMADLVGAFRLPEGAMRAAAGTDVVVDVLFLQRREAGTQGNGAAWANLAEVLPEADGEAALTVNRWFADHPAAVLGLHARTSGPFGPAYTCHYCPNASLEADLHAALDSLPRGIHAPAGNAGARAAASPAPSARVPVGTAAEGAEIKEGSYLLDGGTRLLQVVDGTARPVAVRSGRGSDGIPAKHARIIRLLVPVRDAVRHVLRAQEANEPWAAAQARLRAAYQAFVRQFGPVNLAVTHASTDVETGETREVQRRPNLQPFLDDPDCWLVSSVEDYDEETSTGRMGPVFTERVIHPPAEPVVVTAADALAVALAECGRVDLDRAAERLGRPRTEVVAELGEAVFLDPARTTPEREAWETADAYLSGPVRTKLATAEAAAALDPGYARNVAALRRVQPEDLRPSDITARLGAPWVPADVIEAFVLEVIEVATRVRHTVEVASWSLDVGAFAHRAEATSEWGTHRRHAGQLLDDALNGTTPQVWDTWIEDGKERREINAAETEAAKEKLARIKAAFERWVWTCPERTDRLARIYNDRFNNLVPRHFDGAHLSLPGASSAIRFYPHQKRVIWRVIAAGDTYIAHAVGAGKTYSMAAAIMEQKRLGLISKAMLVVPGHCLAQASREFLQLYPNARILVADESNFTKDKRRRFLARAATATWDAIVITHSAFKFIPVPAGFERRLIADQVQAYEELLLRVDGDDRITRKRIERAKEGLQAKLEALAARKDDLLHLGEIGVDQIVVDEAQVMRKLAFATNMGGLKGVDPEGSQAAWDLYAKSRYVAERNPGRALVLASGTPITNTLGEMFTVQRFMAEESLRERGVHQFDAWAASFGDTRTELELQPSGRYKPVTRFAEFVNVPELVAMFRAFADVVGRDELRAHLRLPTVKGGGRRIVTAEASPSLRAYQGELDRRIRAIEARRGPPCKGQDILLSVITDGRHAAIDLRLVYAEHEDEPGNKLNLLIRNVHRVWQETAGERYKRPDGVAYALPGAGQLVFSDLGTNSAEATRGFSAYRWIKQELVRLGVPAGQVAFMQDHKKSAAKQRLFQEFNAGRVRVLIGSSATMGTGVNVQRRLKALHHLDVPWLPAEIEQREGRIERQGNQHAEVEVLAYATPGSMDATLWQNLERKQRFIAMALAGDRGVRRLEDAGSQANQFALAKAIASGDPRLMQKAGLDAEVARLERLRAAHHDDQHAIRGHVLAARSSIAHATRRIGQCEQDLQRRVPTRAEQFRMEVGGDGDRGRVLDDRRQAGAALLSRVRRLDREQEEGTWRLADIGGFAVSATGRRGLAGQGHQLDVVLERTGWAQEVAVLPELTALGLVSRLEYMLDRFEAELAEHRRNLAEAQARLAGYEQRLGEAFPLQAELITKRAELAAVEAELAASAGESGVEPPSQPVPAEAAE
jgi:N12 class adenine-specific DNA methylase/adenine-specific DNA methylase